MDATANIGACPHAPRGERAQMPFVEQVCHLYECEKLSTYRIAAVVGIDRQRVGRMLRRAGVAVKPRGAGRRRRPDEQTALAEHLYVHGGLSSTAIGELIGVPPRTVRGWLQSRGVPMRTRGRMNREDRQDVPVDLLASLYFGAGLSAAETGRLLGVSGRVVLRTAHDAGLPVRPGGPPPVRAPGPEEIELIEAIYADPLVRRVLARHGVEAVPAGGAIWQRFPAALRVSPELLAELYTDCGLSLRHIELLSGQPEQTLLRSLHRLGVPVRGRGGRSPFRRRWLSAGQAGPAPDLARSRSSSSPSQPPMR